MHVSDDSGRCCEGDGQALDEEAPLCAPGVSLPAKRGLSGHTCLKVVRDDGFPSLTSSPAMRPLTALSVFSFPLRPLLLTHAHALLGPGGHYALLLLRRPHSLPGQCFPLRSSLPISLVWSPLSDWSPLASAELPVCLLPPASPRHHRARLVSAPLPPLPFSARLVVHCRVSFLRLLRLCFVCAPLLATLLSCARVRAPAASPPHPLSCLS